MAINAQKESNMNKQESHELSRKDTIDVVVYKRPASQRLIESNRINGRKGGLVTGIKKGLSATSQEKKEEIRAKALAVRRDKIRIRKLEAQKAQNETL